MYQTSWELGHILKLSDLLRSLQVDTGYTILVPPLFVLMVANRGPQSLRAVLSGLFLQAPSYSSTGVKLQILNSATGQG